jgi:hypothetical protein
MFRKRAFRLFMFYITMHGVKININWVRFIYKERWKLWGHVTALYISFNSDFFNTLKSNIEMVFYLWREHCNVW